MKTCKDCKHFIGGGDWNLCCDVHHPTPREAELGKFFVYGHLCYEDSEICDAFGEKEDK